MGIRFGEYLLFEQERQLFGPEGQVEIGARSFDILVLLLEHPNSVVGKGSLLDTVWPNLTVEENTLQVHISALRKLLGSSLIRTVHGRGYKYSGPEPLQVDQLLTGQRRPVLEANVGTAVSPDVLPGQITTYDLSLPGKPSVAVLPFNNLSRDAAQEYLSSGITDSIIAGLTRFRGLFVISGKSSAAAREISSDVQRLGQKLGVAHLVEGSVLRVGNRLRVSAALVDASSGRHVWAETYDRDLEDIFDLQDEITNMIVVALAGQLEQAGRHRAVRKPAKELETYEFLLRGRHSMKQGTKEGALEARRFFEQGLERDPEFAAICACLADSYIIEYESVWTDARARAIDLALQFAERAVALDPTDSNTWHALAWAQLDSRQYDLSMVSIQRAIALNPNEYDNLCNKGWCLTLMGETREGIACLDEAIRINPFGAVDCHVGKGIAEYTAHRYEFAVQAFGRVSGLKLLRNACLAACYAQLGRKDDATSAADFVIGLARSELAVEPGAEIGAIFGYLEAVFHFRNPESLEHLIEGWRMAGLVAPKIRR